MKDIIGDSVDVFEPEGITGNVNVINGSKVKVNGDIEGFIYMGVPCQAGGSVLSVTGNVNGFDINNDSIICEDSTANISGNVSGNIGTNNGTIVVKGDVGGNVFANHGGIVTVCGNVKGRVKGDYSNGTIIIGGSVEGIPDKKVKNSLVVCYQVNNVEQSNTKTYYIIKAKGNVTLKGGNNVVKKAVCNALNVDEQFVVGHAGTVITAEIEEDSIIELSKGKIIESNGNRYKIEIPSEGGVTVSATLKPSF